MGKTANCILLLQILSSRNIVKVSELADILETNPRNIVEYRKELEEVGYYIESVSGRYGGYRLIKTNILPSLKFTNKEKEALYIGSDYLLSRNDFLFKNDYSTAISKMFSSIIYNDFKNNVEIIYKFPLVMSEDELTGRYSIIKDCLENEICLEITYLSLKNKERKHIIHPYDIFMYNNAWFVLGWNETVSNVGYFKINRIKSLEKLDRNFTRWLSYKKSDYINEYGFVNNGDWYRVKFAAYNSFASFVQEREYGRNQKVEIISENETIVDVEIQNESRLIKFLLSHGEDVKILEPEWLVDKVFEEINKIYKLYSKEKITK